MVRWIGSRHVPGEELVAYADGYLGWDHRQIVDEHLQACNRCRDRLRGFDEVGRIIQEGAPLADDPSGRAALHARLAAGDWSTTTSRQRPSARLLVAASSVVLLLVLLAWPLASAAGFPLSGFLRFGGVAVRYFQPGGDGVTVMRGVATPRAASPDPAIGFVAPDRMPLGLELAERSAPGADQLELLYRNRAGLAVLLSQVPTAAGAVRLAPSPGQEVVRVRGVAVLRLADPRPDAVAGMLWEREGVTFELLAIEPPPDGLGEADAGRIVEALMAAQDAATG